MVYRLFTVAMEVPFISSDSVEWVEAFVPNVNSSAPGSLPAAPPTEDYASSSIIGSPPIYLIWRICKTLPHAIEILEVPADREIKRVGLRILFPDALSPFAYICKNKKSSDYGGVYLLYALSIFGTAYVFELKNISSYAFSYVFSSNEFLHFEMKNCSGSALITVAAATTGCLTLGRDDGSVSCLYCGHCDKNARVSMRELKESPSCFCGPISSVTDLVISLIHGRKTAFVLHSDGLLSGFDLSNGCRLFTESLSFRCGGHVSRLFVGEDDASIIRLMFLVTTPPGLGMDLAYGILRCRRILLSKNKRYPSSLKISSHKFHLCNQAKLIDVNISSNKIWILQEDTLIVDDPDWLYPVQYSLHEAFISEQLFQDSEDSLDVFYRTTCSMFSSKAQMIGFISSIFSHRLLHPRVHNSSAFRSTLEDYGKHWIDQEFESLNFDGLRREILSLIKHEAISGSPLSALKCWKEFCSRYFDRWCKRSAPRGLFVDSLSGAVGLIRQNGVSLFRSLEDRELLLHGTNLKVLEDFPKSEWIFSVDALPSVEREILFQVLRYTRSLSRQLGPAISPAIFYEVVGGAPLMSFEDGVPCLLKTKECGFNTSRSVVALSDLLGADFVWQKALADHRICLNNSFSMLISLDSLRKKYSGWERVLNVIKNYLSFIAPQKQKSTYQNLHSDMVAFNANIPIIVRATSQVAGVMFESALDILLFLSYLSDISSQVHMLPGDISRLLLELIPMTHEIITGWLIIHFFTTMPSKSLLAEDFSSQLSSLKIDYNSRQISWTHMLGSIDFTLAFILLLDAHDSSESWSYQPLTSIPNPGSLTNLVRHFISWIIYSRSGEKSLYGIEHTSELALSLLRHGQYNAVEILLMIVDAYSSYQKLSGGIEIQSTDGDWCVLHHLLECCLLAQAKVDIIDLSKITKSMKP